jgi:hypothetical protein
MLNYFNDTLSQISQISNFFLYTTSLINPHAKISYGVKSGDLGGQAVGAPLLIRTWQELEYTLDIYRGATGAHIEVYRRA